jgi:hypothetical protein
MLRCQRILAMPGKRCVRQIVEFLDRSEMDGLLAAPGSTKYVTCNSCNGKHIRSKYALITTLCASAVEPFRQPRYSRGLRYS